MPLVTNIMASAWLAFSVPAETNWTQVATNFLPEAVVSDFGNHIPWWVLDMSDMGLQKVPRVVSRPDIPREPSRYDGQ